MRNLTELVEDVRRTWNRTPEAVRNRVLRRMEKALSNTSVFRVVAEQVNAVSIDDLAKALRTTRKKAHDGLDTMHRLFRNEVDQIARAEGEVKTAIKDYHASKKPLVRTPTAPAVELTLEFGPDATEAEIKATVAELAKSASAIHRAAGGSGLEIREAHVEQPAPAAVEAQ